MAMDSEEYRNRILFGRNDPTIVSHIRALRTSGMDYVSIIERLNEQGIVAGNLYSHFMQAFDLTIPDAMLVWNWKPDMPESEKALLNQAIQESVDDKTFPTLFPGG